MTAGCFRERRSEATKGAERIRTAVWVRGTPYMYVLRGAWRALGLDGLAVTAVLAGVCVLALLLPHVN
jgi:hypothetical protein